MDNTEEKLVKLIWPGGPGCLNVDRFTISVSQAHNFEPDPLKGFLEINNT